MALVQYCSFASATVLAYWFLVEAMSYRVKLFQTTDRRSATVYWLGISIGVLSMCTVVGGANVCDFIKVLCCCS